MENCKFLWIACTAEGKGLLRRRHWTEHGQRTQTPSIQSLHLLFVCLKLIQASCLCTHLLNLSHILRHQFLNFCRFILFFSLSISSIFAFYPWFSSFSLALALIICFDFLSLLILTESLNHLNFFPLIRVYIGSFRRF